MPRRGPRRYACAGSLSSRILLPSAVRIKAHRKPGGAFPVVEEALKLLRATIPTTIKINSCIDKVSGVVYCDATEIRQIVMNLCTNAFHSMEETSRHPGCGCVRDILEANLATRYPRPFETGPHLVLSVSDTGCGMDDVRDQKTHIRAVLPQPRNRGRARALAWRRSSECTEFSERQDASLKVLEQGGASTISLPCIKKEQKIGYRLSVKHPNYIWI